jgi:PEP-CTERM motif
MSKFGLSLPGAAGWMAPPISDPRRVTKGKETMMRMMMKSLMAGALGSLAAVAVTGGAHAALCPAGGAVGSTLDAYIALGAAGCQIGDKTFSNFSYNGDGTGVLANQVGVTPDAAGNLGVQLNGAWGGPAAGANDVAINFTVAITPGAAPAGTLITDASLQVLNGTGSFLDTEQLFNAVGGALLATITTSDNLLHAAAFAGVLSANETEDLRLNPGAQVSIVDKRFSQSIGPVTTPEPASLAILGISLLGMGVAYRRRRK